MDKENINKKDSLQDRETELLKRLDELKHICFGMYAKIIPPEILASKDSVVNHVIKGISNDIAKESVSSDANNEELEFYSAFYSTAIYFLLACCNEEDQILLSLRKVANTFNTAVRIDVDSTTFSILVASTKLNTSNKKEEIYANNCMRNYEEFKIHYDKYMVPDVFRENVKNGVNKYADNVGYSCITHEEKYAEIIELIDYACNAAYFNVYKR